MCLPDRVVIVTPSLSTVGQLSPFSATSCRRPLDLILLTIAPKVSTWAVNARGLSSFKPGIVAKSAPFVVRMQGIPKASSSFCTRVMAHSVSPVGLGVLSRSTSTRLRYSLSISNRVTRGVYPKGPD